MRIIITGASGFVGKNLSTYLQKENYKVEGLDLRNKDWKNNVSKSSDVMIHLAGKAHDTKNVSVPEDYFKINRDLTIELYNEFLASEMKYFFYFSSVKAVADAVEGILTESSVSNPQTPYGKSKKAAEKYIMENLPEDKQVFIIRPCMIHGPGNKGNLNLLYQIVEKGIPWPLAAFHNQRSFLGIDNLNYLIHQMLLKKDLESGIYNFADDDALSTNDLISIVNLALDKKAKLWNVSKSFIQKSASIGDRLKLPLNSERLQKLTESYVVCNQKIKSPLGIEKLPYSAREGLIKTIKSFKKRKIVS